MTGRHLMLAVALLGASGGALGLEAGRTVDGFYTAPREQRTRAPGSAYRSSSSWATENRTFAASPPPGAVWGQEVGRDERAFFDAGGGLQEEAPVRVYRANVRQAEVAEPEIEQPAPANPLDDWADEPADPDRLPSAG